MWVWVKSSVRRKKLKVCCWLLRFINFHLIQACKSSPKTARPLEFKVAQLFVPLLFKMAKFLCHRQIYHMWHNFCATWKEFTYEMWHNFCPSWTQRGTIFVPLSNLSHLAQFLWHLNSKYQDFLSHLYSKWHNFCAMA